jgi:hypothetical protein
MEAVVQRDRYFGPEAWLTGAARDPNAIPLARAKTRNGADFHT